MIGACEVVGLTWFLNLLNRSDRQMNYSWQEPGSRSASDCRRICWWALCISCRHIFVFAGRCSSDDQMKQIMVDRYLYFNLTGHLSIAHFFSCCQRSHTCASSFYYYGQKIYTRSYQSVCYWMSLPMGTHSEVRPQPIHDFATRFYGVFSLPDLLDSTPLYAALT